MATTTSPQTSPFHPADGPIVLATMKRRKLEMYPLLKQEVTQLIAGYSSPAFALFGVFFGALSALWITCETGGLVEPLKSRFFAYAYISGGLAAICLLRAIREYLDAKTLIATIEKEIIEVRVVQESPLH